MLIEIQIPERPSGRIFTERTRNRLGRKVLMREAPDVLLAQSELSAAGSLPGFDGTDRGLDALAGIMVRDHDQIEFIAVDPDGRLWAVNTEGFEYARYLARAGLCQEGI